MKFLPPFLRILAPATLILFLSLNGHAAVLVQYDFSSASPNTPFLNTTAGGAAWVGMGVNSGFSSGTSSAFVRIDGAPAALDAGKYLTLTLSADAGYVLNLSSISFLFGGSSNGSTTVTNFTQLRSDAETIDYSNSLSLSLVSGAGSVSGGNTAQTTFISNSNSYSIFSADLSSSIYQNLSSLTFRWYVYDNVSSNVGFDRFDSVTINGAVSAVPEPSTWTLLLAGFSLLMLLKLKSKAAM